MQGFELTLRMGRRRQTGTRAGTPSVSAVGCRDCVGTSGGRAGPSGRPCRATCPWTPSARTGWSWAGGTESTPPTWPTPSSPPASPTPPSPAPSRQWRRPSWWRAWPCCCSGTWGWAGPGSTSSSASASTPPSSSRISADDSVLFLFVPRYSQHPVRAQAPQPPGPVRTARPLEDGARPAPCGHLHHRGRVDDRVQGLGLSAGQASKQARHHGGLPRLPQLPSGDITLIITLGYKP
eukprot:jgi/Botrbrau1/20502/Bobra.145_2s0060.1